LYESRVITAAYHDWDEELRQTWEVKGGQSPARIVQLDNLMKTNLEGGWGVVFVQNPYTGVIGPKEIEMQNILSRGGSIVQIFTRSEEFWSGRT